MSNPEAIYKFLRDNAPFGYCDDRVSENTGVQPRQQVHPICSALGLTTDFQRGQNICKFCKATHEVTSICLEAPKVKNVRPMPSA